MNLEQMKQNNDYCYKTLSDDGKEFYNFVIERLNSVEDTPERKIPIMLKYLGNLIIETKSTLIKTPKYIKQIYDSHHQKKIANIFKNLKQDHGDVLDKHQDNNSYEIFTKFIALQLTVLAGYRDEHSENTLHKMKVSFQDIFCKGEHIKKDAKQSVDSFIKDCKNAKDNQHTDLISALTDIDAHVQGYEESQATPDFDVCQELSEETGLNAWNLMVDDPPKSVSTDRL